MSTHTVTVYGPGGYDPSKPNNNVVDEYEAQDPPFQGLDRTGALAALLAATSVLTVTDAANAVGQTPDALIAEVEAWAAAEGQHP